MGNKLANRFVLSSEPIAAAAAGALHLHVDHGSRTYFQECTSRDSDQKMRLLQSGIERSGYSRTS